MNSIKVDILGGLDVKPTLMIDNQFVKIKKDKFGNYQANFQTEKDTVELAVYKYLELKSKLWFLMAFVFFVISLFGILNPRYDKSCIVLEYKIKIKLNSQTEIKLAMNKFQNNGRAYEISTDCKYEEITNLYYVDQVAKKRLKILKVITIISWVILVILGLYLLVNK